MRVRVGLVALVVVFGCAWMSGDAVGKDEDITTRDLQQAFRTLRDAVARGAEPGEFGKPQILEVIQDLGGTDAKNVRDDWMTYVVKVNGEDKEMQLVFYDDGDLQLRWQVSGDHWTPTVMNAWNMSHRVGKAYLAKDGGSIVVEYTLLNAQGRSRQWLKGAMKVFHHAAGLFEAYAKKTIVKEAIVKPEEDK